MHPARAIDFLRYAADNPHPEFEAYSLGEIYIDGARQNDKHPAWARIMLPDHYLKNIRGNEELQDIYLFLKFPREVWERYSLPSANTGNGEMTDVKEESTKEAEETSLSQLLEDASREEAP